MTPWELLGYSAAAVAIVAVLIGIYVSVCIITDSILQYHLMKKEIEASKKARFNTGEVRLSKETIPARANNAALSFALEYIGDLCEELLENDEDACVEKYAQFMIKSLDDEHPLIREGAVLGLECIARWDNEKNTEAEEKIKKLLKEDPCNSLKMVYEGYLAERAYWHTPG